MADTGSNSLPQRIHNNIRIKFFCQSQHRTRKHRLSDLIFTADDFGKTRET